MTLYDYDDYAEEPVKVYEYIHIIVNEFDVDAIADDHHISRTLAHERMEEWAKHISSTMTGYVMEQVEGVIRDGQP